MLPSLFSAALALAAPLFTFAAPVNVTNGRAPSILIVNMVSFEDTVASNVPLQIDGKSLSLSSQEEGGVLEFSDSSDVTFSFLEANSSFIGYDSTDSVKYGHISLPSSNSTLHLSVTTAPTNPVGQTLVLANAAISDDSSQYFQTFKLDTAAGTVEFVGNSKVFPTENWSGPFGPGENSSGDVTLAAQSEKKFTFALSSQ